MRSGIQNIWCLSPHAPSVSITPNSLNFENLDLDTFNFILQKAKKHSSKFNASGVDQKYLWFSVNIEYSIFADAIDFLKILIANKIGVLNFKPDAAAVGNKFNVFVFSDVNSQKTSSDESKEVNSQTKTPAPRQAVDTKADANAVSVAIAMATHGDASFLFRRN